ncbi:Gfo/Idh/MocA family oxidoreductase [Herbiconiux sp. 11R-BC]|uniref:Gfo/Idh/MocA family protein n=1 Tax=Herbiconiux sp. 11R-BC TaxID=3111637 RepID=UPI003BFB3C11
MRSSEQSVRRFIQIGLGWWGEGWARELAASPRSELVAIVDSDAAALRSVGDALGLPEAARFTRPEDALAAIAADAALVVVPPALHAPVSILCLNAGLDVLLEKPFAPTLEEARPVVELADSLGRALMISQTFRFRRGPRTVQQLIATGRIGRVEQVFGTFQKASPFTGFRTEMAEPLIVDMAIHHFDFVRGVFGLEPVRVRARSFNPSWSWFAGNASALVEFETADGAVVSWTGSYVSRGPLTTWDGSWDVHGTRGSLHWAANEVTLRPSEFADTIYLPGGLEKSDDVMAMSLVDMPQEERAAVLDEFLDALGEGREPVPSGRDNLGSIALVLAAAESARRGGEPVELS